MSLAIINTRCTRAPLHIGRMCRRESCHPLIPNRCFWKFCAYPVKFTVRTILITLPFASPLPPPPPGPEPVSRAMLKENEEKFSERTTVIYTRRENRVLQGGSGVQITFSHPIAPAPLGISLPLHNGIFSSLQYFACSFVSPGMFGTDGQLVPGTMCDHQFVSSQSTPQHGRFYSPRYPSSYPKNVQCSYLFRAR